MVRLLKQAQVRQKPGQCAPGKAGVHRGDGEEGKLGKGSLATRKVKARASWSGAAAPRERGYDPRTTPWPSDVMLLTSQQVSSRQCGRTSRCADADYGLLPFPNWNSIFGNSAIKGHFPARPVEASHFLKARGWPPEAQVPAAGCNCLPVPVFWLRTVSMF